MYNQFSKRATKAGGLHGDVGLKRVAELPANAKPFKSRVVAEGEVTGHHHVIVGDGVEMYEAQVDGAKNLFAVVTGQDVTIQHQEHGKIELVPGTYWVVRQVEYDGEEERRVLD